MTLLSAPHLDIDHLWIDSNTQLRDCCRQLSLAPAIAVDTEFMRTNTFYPKAALFQLYDGTNCYLVDPLPITDFSPLVELLINPEVVKVFHACSEDLEVFQHFLNCLPEPLVDTQIAAALLPHGSSASYASMVETVLGHQLDKGETRSDWLRRPLAERQLHYAAQDVVYLLDIYHHLMHELEQLGRRSWLQEECEALLASARNPAGLDDFYPRIKSAWKLRPQELLVLKELSHWREVQARELDMPRNHVVHERTLWDVAKKQPRNINGLRGMDEMHGRTLRRWGDALLEVVARAQALGPEHYPDPLPPPLPLNQRKLSKALRVCAGEKAETLQIAPDMLVRKADFDYLIRSGMDGGSYRLPPRLQGWRRPVIGDALMAMVEELSSSQPEEGADG